MSGVDCQNNGVEGREKKRLEVCILDEHLTQHEDAKLIRGHLREQRKSESVRHRPLYVRLLLPTRKARSAAKTKR